MNKHLLSFFLGVVVTAAIARLGFWGLNLEWEMQAVNKGYGLFAFNVYDKPDWDGNQKLRFYWQDENPKKSARTAKVTRICNSVSKLPEAPFPVTSSVVTATPTPASVPAKSNPNR